MAQVADSVREVTFPRAFIIDCIESDCDVGEVVRDNGRKITLAQTDEQRAELASRAKHYAHGGLDGAPLWMTRSARYVLACLGEAA